MYYTISGDLSGGDRCIARKKLIALKNFSGDHCFKDPTYPVKRAKTSPSQEEEFAPQRMHILLGRIQDSRLDDAYPYLPGLEAVRVKATPSPSPPPFILQQIIIPSSENVSPHSLKKRRKANRRRTSSCATHWRSTSCPGARYPFKGIDTPDLAKATPS